MKVTKLRKVIARNKKAIPGLVLLSIVMVAAVFAPLLAPHDPNEQNTSLRLRPPAALGGPDGFVLGTDPLGRDVLSRVIYGARVSLLVGLVSVAIAGVIGVVLGVIAGYYGRVADVIVMRLVDFQMAIPFLLLALGVMAVLGPSLRNVIIVLAITGWVVYARVARAQVLAMKQKEFVQSAVAAGASDLRILVRYILPNILPPLVVVATVEVGRTILAEASLSFLGLGVEPSTATWGSIAADGRDYVSLAWWVSTVPGFAILLTVLGTNFLGDWLREKFDPTLRI
ncbi:MAG: ABC transporter permease [Bacteroidota bacterium]